MVELDPPLHRQPGVGADLGGLFLCVEQFEDPLGGRHTGLEHVEHARGLREGLGELARVLDERLHVADAHGPRRHAETTHDRDGDIVQVADEHHRRLDGTRDELCPVAGAEQFLVHRREALLHVALAAERLHDGMTGERLLDETVQDSRGAPLVDELRPRALGDLLHRDGRQGDDEERDQSEDPRDREHHHEHAHHGEERRDQLTERLLQALADVVDVVRDTAQQVAAGVPVDVAEGQPVELLLHLAAQFEHGALHHTRQQVRLRVREQVRQRVDPHRHPQRVVQGREVDSPRVVVLDQRLGQQVRGMTEDARSGDHQGDTHDRHHEDGDDEHSFPCQQTGQTP